MSKMVMTHSAEETLQIQTVKLNQQLNMLLEQNTRILELEAECKSLTLIALGELSLNQVRADAGRAGFIAGYMLCNDDSPLIKHNYEGFANQYHANILAGKE